jgi:hypothetical protein
MLHVMVAFEQATPEVEGNCGSQLLRPPMKWSLNGADGNVWRRASGSGDKLPCNATASRRSRWEHLLSSHFRDHGEVVIQFGGGSGQPMAELIEGSVRMELLSQT